MPCGFGPVCRQLTGYTWSGNQLLLGWLLTPKASLEAHEDIGVASVLTAADVHLRQLPAEFHSPQVNLKCMTCCTRRLRALQSPASKPRTASRGAGRKGAAVRRLNLASPRRLFSRSGVQERPERTNVNAMWGSTPRNSRLLVAIVVGLAVLLPVAPASARIGGVDAAQSAAAAATISSVSPMSGAVGTAVTITGTNFVNVSNVTFYDSPSPSWTVNSPTSITAVVPYGTPSPGRWRVITPDGTAVYDPTFTVTGTPTITSVSPTSGPVGSTVTITGTNLVNVSKVTFYDTPSPSFTVNSPTSITATVPAGTPSPGRWRVVNPAYTAVYDPLFTVGPDSTAPTTPTGLHATGAAQTSITLGWNASSDNVGVTGYNVYRGGSLAGTSTTTSFTAGSLTCSTSYTLTVQAKDAANNVSGQSVSVSASTSACSTSDPFVTAAGDICSNATNCKPTSDLIFSLNPTRVLTLGDNAYNDGSLTQYNTYYDPNWGRFKSKTSPTTGNHEYHIPGAADYFTYFGSVAPAPYYSYDIGAWHLIALADGSSGGISPSAGGAEETWLKQDLAAHTNKCVLAYWHEPRWSSGTTHGSSSTWSAVWNDLYAAKADVVLSGHEHNYERFAKQNGSGVADPKGIREFVVGTGGASHGYPFGTPIANSEVRNDSTWGVLKLTLHATSYDWQFVPVAGSTFTDSGSDTCS